MRTVLVIDDEVDARRTLREFLTREGLLVHSARDGQHALSILERIEPPDLILLDYKMPVMDGKQFLGLMRRIPKLQATPVVLLSAATREWSGATLEVDDVLTKPIDLDVLLSTVNRILARHSAAS